MTDNRKGYFVTIAKSLFTHFHAFSSNKNKREISFYYTTYVIMFIIICIWYLVNFDYSDNCLTFLFKFTKKSHAKVSVTDLLMTPQFSLEKKSNESEMGNPQRSQYRVCFILE